MPTDSSPDGVSLKADHLVGDPLPEIVVEGANASIVVSHLLGHASRERDHTADRATGQCDAEGCEGVHMTIMAAHADIAGITWPGALPCPWGHEPKDGAE